MVANVGDAALSPVRKLTPEARLPTPELRGYLKREQLRLVKRLLKSPLECQYHPAFDEPCAEERFLAPIPREAPRPRRKRHSDDSGVHLLDNPPQPNSDRERRLFLRLNYCRFRIMQVVERFANRRLTLAAVAELELWHRRAAETRSDIVAANVPLVLAMAKRTRVTSVDFAELISEGNMALLRAVDKFDCSRGFKFSTYACRAILKAFSRQGMKLSKYRQRFPTDFDPALEKSNHLETLRRQHELESAEEVKHVVLNNDADLTDVEQTVIHHRFGIDLPENQEPLTLEQVGQIIGVTKERVRQIQNKALEKIRLALEANAAEKAEQLLAEQGIDPGAADEDDLY